MNRESACKPKNQPFCIKTVPFSEIPKQSALFLDFQSDSTKIIKFYPESKTSLEKFSEKVLANYRTDREKLCDILLKTNRSFGAGEKTLNNIGLLRRKDCLAVVTGQQAGLFSGAIYTIYKALSAVKLAEELKQKNINAVPVFWIAEEDHDFREIKKTFVLGKENKLNEIENEPKNFTENQPVGFIRLDETIEQTIEELFESLPHTEFTGELKQLLSETYRSGESYSISFAKFLAKIFHDYGIIFLTPLDEDLKKLCAPIFAEAVEKSVEITGRLLHRNAELKEANYHAQVLVEENSFPFFWINEKGERKALRRELPSGKIKAQGSKVEFTEEELKKIAETAPQSLSPNALLRPVVQDYLLPTAIYFGGAAEIAYFAQNSVIYETLNRPVTPVRHRAGLTIVEPKNRRTMERYDLQFTDLFKGKEKISARIVEKYLNNGTAREFAEVEEIVNTQLNRLDRHLSESEPTLAANLANRRRKIIWHLETLRKKYHRAEITKNEVAHRRIETLFTALLPKDALQERTLNVITFLNLFGFNFIDWIYEAIDSDDNKEHRLIYL